MRHKLWISVLLMLCLRAAPAQQLHSAGNASPVIKGAKAKVEYFSSRISNLQLPPALANYLAGIMVYNKVKSDTSSLNKALGVWISKYRELQKAINNLPDKNKRELLQYTLDRGDFATVESQLSVKTSYRELQKLFPETYQTTGNQSPLIVGDFATVTYVVKEVINVNLDESLISNILNDLKAKQKIIDRQGAQLRQIRSLSIDLPTLGNSVASYIASYKLVKEEIAKTPAAIYKKAYGFFVKGDFDRVLQILDSAAKTSDKYFGRINLLKARILLLQYDYPSLDSVTAEINRAYLLGVELLPTVENCMGYGQFLVDYVRRPQAAIYYFEKIQDSAMPLVRRAQLYNYLSLAYGNVDRIRAIGYLNKGLDLVNSGATPADSAALTVRAQLFYNLAQAYAASQISPEQVKIAAGYLDSALASIGMIPRLSENEIHKTAVYYVRRGSLYATIGDTTSALKDYQAAVAALEKINPPSSDIYSGDLSEAYTRLSEFYYQHAHYDSGIIYLRKAIRLIEPRASLSNRNYAFFTIQAYSNLYYNYESTGDITGQKAILYHLLDFIEPYSKADSVGFGAYKAAFFSNMGMFCLAENRIDSAEYYISGAFEYFHHNINIIQADKNTVSKALFLKNNLLLKQEKYAEALSLNRKLLNEFIQLEKLNKLNYEDFVPQVKSQLAEVYLKQQNFDSAGFYSDAVLKVMYPKAAQYGMLYQGALNNYLFQACAIRLTRHDLKGADSIAMSYIRHLAPENTIDPFVRDNMQQQLGDYIAGMAYLFHSYTSIADNTKNTPREENLALFNLTVKYLDAAGLHFQTALAQFPAITYRYAKYLYEYAVLIDTWLRCCLDQQRSEMMTRKRCELLSKAKPLAGLLDINPVSLRLQKNIDSCFNACH